MSAPSSLLAATPERPLCMIVAYIDGGSRGNPGPAGYGVRIEDEQGPSSTSCAGSSAFAPTTRPSIRR